MSNAPMKRFVIATDWDDAPGLNRVASVRRSFDSVREAIGGIVKNAHGEFDNDGRSFGDVTSPAFGTFGKSTFLIASMPAEKAEKAQEAIRSVKGVLAVEPYRAF